RRVPSHGSCAVMCLCCSTTRASRSRTSARRACWCSIRSSTLRRGSGAGVSTRVLLGAGVRVAVLARPEVGIEHLLWGPGAAGGEERQRETGFGGRVLPGQRIAASEHLGHGGPQA